MSPLRQASEQLLSNPLLPDRDRAGAVAGGFHTTTQGHGFAPFDGFVSVTGLPSNPRLRAHQRSSFRDRGATSFRGWGGSNVASTVEILCGDLLLFGRMQEVPSGDVSTVGCSHKGESLRPRQPMMPASSQRGLPVIEHEYNQIDGFVPVSLFASEGPGSISGCSNPAPMVFCQEV